MSELTVARAKSLAKPGLDHLPSLLAELRDEAANARKDPAELASFRALRLNQGTSDTERRELIGASTWRKAEGSADQAARMRLASTWADRRP